MLGLHLSRGGNFIRENSNKGKYHIDQSLPRPPNGVYAGDASNVKIKFY